MNNISVVKVINGSELEIAHYNSDTQQLMIIVNVLESDSPHGGISVIFNENTILHIEKNLIHLIQTAEEINVFVTFCLILRAL